MFFDKVSLVTGGFDPIHSGHIAYFKRAKDLSNYLVVGINSNEWLTSCLLYTSDAADEGLGVDLGGRRIMK